MRKFIVFGFDSVSKNAPGETVYLGTDRGEAISAVNDPDGGYVRKELYALAVPDINRHFELDSDAEE